MNPMVFIYGITCLLWRSAAFHFKRPQFRAIIIQNSNMRSSATTNGKEVSSAYIALGSNIGERSVKLKEAIDRISRLGELVRTSHLYQSSPMYFTDQPAFLNAACQILTRLSPTDLLQELKAIESALGREETFRNGPRILDLDIVLYGDKQIVNNPPLLLVPHPRMKERAFVLRPLLDIDETLVDPISGMTIRAMWEGLTSDQRSELTRVIPIYNKRLGRTRYVSIGKRLPILMGILNITPDSFSDGGKYSNNVTAAVAQALQMERDGALIIDIGGESTRPKARTVDISEEIERVVPVIRAIRDKGCHCLISIDTRKVEVAKAAIEAGADIVNDVSAGTYDPNMIEYVASLGLCYIAMHMRGDPSNMQDARYCSYNDVVKEVGEELRAKMNPLDSKIPRWLQVIDPGIGFAKNAEHNLALLKPESLRRFKSLLDDRPLLVALSRKRFLNSSITSADNIRRSMLLDANLVSVDSSLEMGVPTQEFSLEERDMMTAGSVCSAVLGGADILRVHNVKATRLAIDSFASCLGYF